MNRESFGIYGNQYEEDAHEVVCIYGNNRIRKGFKTNKNLISKSDDKIFSEIAKSFNPKLVQILNKNRSYILRIYKETGYEKEIEFEEFFIWWYHFIYTKATDIMHEKGTLAIPESGNFEFIIKRSS